MVDINKLRYDLAMNCALAQVLENKEDSTDSLASAMTEAFESSYLQMCMMDRQKMLKLIESMKVSESLTPNSVDFIR